MNLSMLLLWAAPLLGVVRDPQIDWQRNLEDALAISVEESRPILVVVNMDGESASERIVREKYRDPEFVALTRPYVCLVASVFRHTPLDFDERGGRIPCPRLGQVTCAEHIALEPVLYDRFLGGDRIAPRHALVNVEGETVFDLTLLFDLDEIDRNLSAQADLAPPASSLRIGRETTSLDQVVRHFDRMRIETRLSNMRDLSETLSWIGEHGDARWEGALRILFSRVLDRDSFRERHARAVLDAFSAVELEPVAAEVLHRRLTRNSLTFGRTELGREADLIALFEMFNDLRAQDRSLLLSYLAFSPSKEGKKRDSAHVNARGALLGMGVLSGEDGHEGFEPVSFRDVLRLGRGVRQVENRQPTEELPAAAELERRMSELEAALIQHPADPGLSAELGKSTLSLARRRIESGAAGIDLLLEDAERALSVAHEGFPEDVSLLLDLARVSYLQSKFEQQERYARLAVQLTAEGEALWPEMERPAIAAVSDERVEAMRWLGDAAARLLNQRSSGDPLTELRGITEGGRSLLVAALSAESDVNDWVSVSSFFGAIGRHREELALAHAGLTRFPDANELQRIVQYATFSTGRPQLAARLAENLAWRNPDSAVSAWYAGLACFLQAEWLRREERPDRAIAVYRRAEAHLLTARELRGEFADSCEHYLAMASLGRGFAHLLADRREPASVALVEGLAMRPSIALLRDGLDREAVDLVDGSLEWRAIGSSPVDLDVLIEGLESADPKNAFWARSIADSQLREALRAEGRADPAAYASYMQRSIEFGRRAVEIEDSEENKRVLAQSLTILAESDMARDDQSRAPELLAEAARMMEISYDGPTFDLARKLREELGEARPITRPGR